MAGKGNINNLRRSPITRKLWDKMLAAYKERATIKHICDNTDAGRKLATRAVREGWPEMGLPSFIEVLGTKGNSGTTVLKEMATTRASWEDTAMEKGEAARQAAEEALAARTVMSSSLNVLKKLERYADKIIDAAILEGAPEEVTPKHVQQVISAIERTTAITERAMRIERMRAGEPEQVLGLMLGQLLDRCNQGDLVYVVQTGHMPSHLVDQRRTVMAQIGAGGETDAEAAALEAGQKPVIDVPAEAVPGRASALPPTLEVPPLPTTDRKAVPPPVGLPGDQEDGLSPQDILEGLTSDGVPVDVSPD
jgi:hypothetical protein